MTTKWRSLHIVLTKTELATEEDKSWQIDHWARLFKAKTWEELKMIAMLTEDNKRLTEENARLKAALNQNS